MLERHSGKLTNKPRPIHKKSVVKRLDIDEQYWRTAINAAVTNANSTVQRNPKSGIGSEQPDWQQDLAASPTTSVQLTKIWCGKRLDMDEQPKNWRMVINAAVVNANSIVECNPKSKGSGEEKNWRQTWADLEEDFIADDG